MMLLRNGLIALLLIVATGAFVPVAVAQSEQEQTSIYRKVGPDGTVTFTDAPSSGASKVDIGPVQEFSAPQPRNTVRPNATRSGMYRRSRATAKGDDEQQAGARVRYKTLEVVAPKEVFRDEVSMSDAILVKVKIEPMLQLSDRVELYLDGEMVAESQDVRNPIEFRLSKENIFRGEHGLQAKVVSGESKKLPSGRTVPPKEWKASNLFKFDVFQTFVRQGSPPPAPVYK